MRSYRIASYLRDIDLKCKTILYSKVHRDELYSRLGELIVTNLLATAFFRRSDGNVFHVKGYGTPSSPPLMEKLFFFCFNIIFYSNSNSKKLYEEKNVGKWVKKSLKILVTLSARQILLSFP